MADYLLADEGKDPYLEQPGTLWLLHYLLVTRGRANLYDLVFNDFRREHPIFTKPQLAKYADSYCQDANASVSTGTIQLSAGDEFGRSQHGNNNAYAQDNPVTWVDWDDRDRALEDYVAALAAWRAARDLSQFPQDGAWTALDGAPMDAARWEDPATAGFVWHQGKEAALPKGLRIDRAAPQAGPAAAPLGDGRPGSGSGGLPG